MEAQAITRSAAAALLGCHPRTLDKWAKERPEIAALSVTVGDTRKWRADLIDAYLRREEATDV